MYLEGLEDSGQGDADDEDQGELKSGGMSIASANTPWHFMVSRPLHIPTNELYRERKGTEVERQCGARRRDLAATPKNVCLSPLEWLKASKMAKNVKAPPATKAKTMARMSNVLSRLRTVPGMRLCPVSGQCSVKCGAQRDLSQRTRHV